MAYELLWSEVAKNDLREILAYITEDNPAAAARLKQRIDHVVGIASQLPYAFREGRMPGTREVLATATYLVVYRVRRDVVEISGVVHTSRDYPNTTQR